MKTLLLIRHAKASRDLENIEDIDRPLTSRGYADAYLMAEELKKRKVITDLIVTSPAVRAISTAIIFARTLNYPLYNLLVCQEIYSDQFNSVLNILKQLPEELSSVMIFGHNPAFEDLAEYLSVKPVQHIHTCGILCLENKNGEQLLNKKMKNCFYINPKQFMISAS